MDWEWQKGKWTVWQRREKCAVKLVLAFKSDSKIKCRWHAIELLRKARPEAAVVVPALIERLKDENNRVRGLAAIALGEMGPLARGAVPALRETLKDEYVNVREAAAETLKKTDPDERR